MSIGRRLLSRATNGIASSRWLALPALLESVVTSRPASIALGDVRSILIVRTDEAGDFVLSSPLLRELRRNAPSARVTLLVKDTNLPLARNCPYVDEVIGLRFNDPMDVRERVRRYAAAVRIGWRVLRQRRFDLALVPRWDYDETCAGAIAWYSRSKCRVGFSERVNEYKARENSGNDRFFTDVLPGAGTRHEVERNLDVLRSVGGSVDRTHLEVWTTKKDDEDVDELLTSSGFAVGGLSTRCELIAICPGGRRGRRLWPVARYAQVVERLAARADRRFIIIGGSGDREMGDEICRGIGAGTALNAAGKLSMSATAALLRRCRMYIGNDTGPMHLAAAAGASVVEVSCHPQDGSALHPNSPDRFQPWNVPFRVCRPMTSVSPCRDGCESSDPHCILQVKVEEVAAAAEELLVTI